MVLNGFGIGNLSSVYTLLPFLSDVLKACVFHPAPPFAFEHRSPVHLSEAFTHGDRITKRGEAAMLNYGNVEAFF